MTIKELKEELSKFSDDCVIYIQNPNRYIGFVAPPYLEVTDVSIGDDEMVVFAHYEEDDDE